MEYSERYKKYDNDKLLQIVEEGKSEYVVEALEAARKILESRGLKSEIEKRIGEKFIKYTNAELIQVLKENTKNQWNAEDEVVEDILIKRGYDRETIERNKNVDEKEIERLRTILFEKDILIVDEEIRTVEDTSPRRKLLTRKNIKIYENEYLRSVKEEIPIGSFVGFRREVIRNGNNLLLIKYPDNTSGYIKNNNKDVQICNEYRVTEEHLDFIIIKHTDFKKYKAAKEIQIKEIIRQDDKKVVSQIIKNNTSTEVLIKDTYRQAGDSKLRINFFKFRISARNVIKIGRLNKGARFYLVGEESKNQPLLIKTESGLEGIIISNEKVYKRVIGKVENIVNGVLILTFLLSCIIIFLIMSKSGFIVVSGILGLLLFGFLVLIIGVPLYLILDYLAKRL